MLYPDANWIPLYDPSTDPNAAVDVVDEVPVGVVAVGFTLEVGVAAGLEDVPALAAADVCNELDVCETGGTDAEVSVEDCFEFRA